MGAAATTSGSCSTPANRVCHWCSRGGSKVRVGDPWHPDGDSKATAATLRSASSIVSSGSRSRSSWEASFAKPSASVSARDADGDVTRERSEAVKAAVAMLSADRRS